MNIKSIMSLFVCIYIFTILTETVHSQGPYPYGTEPGCSMYGFNASYIIVDNFKPYDHTDMAPNTCQASHPEYSNSSCCTFNQTLVLSDNMVMGAAIFGRCPACLYNVWDLWCASSCSPYQSSFMIPTKNNTEGKISNIDFILHPDYAWGLYNSCKDVNSNGAPPFGTLCPTPLLFFQSIFSTNPAFSINWVFNETGYNGNITPCTASCSCGQCSDSCTAAPAVNNIVFFNQSLPSTYMFDQELPWLTVGLIWGFVIFILSLLLLSSGWMLYKKELLLISTSNQKIGVFMALFIVYVIAILIPFIIGAVDLPTQTTQCLWKMPGDHEWYCDLALFVGSYVMFALTVLFVMTLVIYLLSLSSQPIPGSSSDVSVRLPNSDSPSDSPLLQSSSSENSSSFTAGNFVQKLFYKYGQVIASRPLIVIGVCLIFTVVMGVGIKFLQIEEDPVKLWVAPGSRAALDKDYFDSNFGPFYRVEQLIITPKQPVDSIFQYDLLLELFNIEIQLMNLVTNYNNKTVTLQDLCFQPTKKGCLVESVSGLWQRDISKLNTTQNNILGYYESCQSNLLGASCMDAVGAPVNPSVVLGGWEKNSTNATTFVTTFLLNNPNSQVDEAMAWENVWLATIQNISKASTVFDISYSAERSVQDELSRESEADVPTIIISYSVMFLYVSFALGSYYPFPNRFSSILVRSRFALGLCGILVVASSIVIAVGICSYGGLKATLIISEVIPFLVLAIGVDNIFIMVNTFETLHVVRYDPQTGASILPTAEDSLARTLSKVGPSMALASLSEALAFLLGSFTGMPAVQAFSYYASVAILFDFLLQISAFASLLVLDTKRTESRRIDCFPCAQLGGDNSDDEDEDERQPFMRADINNNLNSQYKLKKAKKTTLLQLVFKNTITPLVVNPIFKIFSIVFFIGMLLVGINYSFQVSIGLDQRVALPRDSYLQAYFDNLANYLEVGPPFYIVVKGDYDYVDVATQNDLCTVAGCNNNSLVNVFNNAPYISQGISSWLDDYLSWSQTFGCCLSYPNGTICTDPTCSPCFLVTSTGRPTPEDFQEYLHDFLGAPNTASCPIAGLAYTSDTNIQNGTIIASRFDGYHTPLRTQNDYINAIQTAYFLADESKLDVMVYSIFYVYFEAYLTIKSVAITCVLLALAGVFVMCLILLMNPLVSLLVVISVGMICIDLLGIMTLWNISLNAVSVVNLVMAIGIGIEFNVHIASAFVKAPKHLSREQRVKYALNEMGANIISGIFITKLLGVSVLGFSSSEIFTVYYFRMYLSIVILGALHGIILLPVLLCLFGSDAVQFDRICSKKDKYSLSEE
ncbi:hypothetical protein DICPUDRAFT_157858 [Dictyostelium purpureum]|uniref:SSD domain-containing protein n=1 Tax=Dictyostelium purpureum TaxID=5786 RepID=F1A064_DICPU|nr:uncharacterized protein DICPUDRAFT_157858 [Dictyostelium purpureum]EGC30415.1 hypothetical protein DICPUDRAFT_157858 [Dictyostelium purpureum]|eukprot:XP_003293060.1 hypothetical protein DICPUDRAFT_157858 [Dictyostelium purpureum]